MKRTASGLTPLIVLDRGSSLPIHEQIGNALRKSIVDGRLKPGQQVPSTRALAPELGVSRFSILTAYSQLLDEGYLKGRVGSGTVVSSTLPEHFLESAPAGKAKTSPASHPALQKSADEYSHKPLWLRGRGPFHIGEVAFDLFPHQAWSKIVIRQSREERVNSLRYGEALGSLSLRKEIAAYLSTARSVRCEAEQIMIVNGAQQAFDLCARVLTRAGDAVWVEDPGYRPARNAFELQGCRFVPVPVDQQGMNCAAGVKLCSDAKAAIVTPSHQLPLGVTMPPARRLQLLAWAKKANAWIIEDDYDSEYRYDFSPIPSLQGLDEDGRVIYVGTFSKVLFPSLRLGYVVVPRPLLERFIRMRSSLDNSSPQFFQQVVAEFIRDGHFARHLRRMRTAYGKRRNLLVRELNSALGGSATVIGAEAGTFVTITIAKGLDDVALANRAAAAGLWLWPLSTCYVGQPEMRGFMLGFGNSTEANIRRGVAKLKEILGA